jgi:hypothetical protein
MEVNFQMTIQGTTLPELLEQLHSHTDFQMQAILLE